MSTSVIMIDFKKVITQSPLYNFHTHTQYCDGHAPMEDFVIEAISQGFIALGFTPHSPLPFESSCNMTRASVPLYLDEVKRLRCIYGDRIAIYTGMEIDYVDDFGPSAGYYDDVPLDYRIGSVHFIPSFDNPSQYIDIDGRFARFKEKMGQYFHGDIERVVRSYFTQSMAMVQAGGFDVIGHLDKIGLNASLYSPGIDQEEWYKQLVNDLFEAVMDHHLVVEVNSKALAEHHRLFPDVGYADLLCKYDVPVLFNSDAHYPALINAGRMEAMRLFSAG